MIDAVCEPSNGHELTQQDRAKGNANSAKARRSVLSELVDMQTELMNKVLDKDTSNKDKAACARAYQVLEAQRRAALGLPNPKPVEVERKRKPKAQAGSAAPIEP